jgi:hypothetical protein
MCWISSIIGAILVTKYYIDAIDFKDNEGMIKLYWALSNISMILAFLIGVASSIYYGN